MIKRSKKITDILKKVIKLSLPGNFTVEASVIVPITLIIAASVIFMSFYYHDVISMKSVSTELAIQNAEMYKTDEGTASAGDRDSIKEKLIIADNADVSVSKDKSGMTAAGSVDINIPLAMVRDIAGTDNGPLSINVRITHLDAREELLKYKALADLGK